MSILADTALAATSNCPAPNTLIKYVKFSHVSTQSWFHVEKKHSHSQPYFHTRQCHTCKHRWAVRKQHTLQYTSCPSLPRILQSLWMRWLQDSKQTPTKNKQKKSLVLDKSSHSFRQAPPPSIRCLVQQDYSAATAAAASGLAAVSGSVGEASAGFSSPPSAATGGSSAFTSASSAFGFSASASLAPSAAASAGLASSEVPSSAAFSPSAGPSAAPSSTASSDSFLVFLNVKPLSLKEGFLKEKRFFFCFPSSLVDGVPSSGLAEASPFVAAGSFSPLASATSAFSPSSFGASSVGVLPLACTSALLASSAAGEVSPLVLACPFSWRNKKY